MTSSEGPGFNTAIAESAGTQCDQAGTINLCQQMSNAYSQLSQAGDRIEKNANPQKSLQIHTPSVSHGANVNLYNGSRPSIAIDSSF